MFISILAVDCNGLDDSIYMEREPHTACNLICCCIPFCKKENSANRTGQRPSEPVEQYPLQTIMDPDPDYAGAPSVSTADENITQRNTISSEELQQIHYQVGTSFNELKDHCLYLGQEEDFRLSQLHCENTGSIFEFDRSISVNPDAPNALFVFRTVTDIIKSLVVPLKLVYGTWDFDVVPTGSFPIGLKVGHADEFDYHLNWRSREIIHTGKRNRLNYPDYFSPMYITRAKKKYGVAHFLNTADIILYLKQFTADIDCITDVSLHGPAACVTITWICPSGHKHLITCDLTISITHPFLKSSNILTTPNYHYVTCSENNKAIPMIRKDPYETFWAPATYELDNAVFSYFDRYNSNVKCVLRLVKYIGQMGLGYELTSRSGPMDGSKFRIKSSVSSHVWKHLVLREAELIENPAKWRTESDVLDRVYSVLESCLHLASMETTYQDVYLGTQLLLHKSNASLVIQDLEALLNCRAPMSREILDVELFRGQRVLVYAFSCYHLMPLSVLTSGFADKQSSFRFYSLDQYMNMNRNYTHLPIVHDILAEFRNKLTLSIHGINVHLDYRESPKQLHFAWLLAQCKYSHNHMSCFNSVWVRKESLSFQQVMLDDLHLARNISAVFMKGRRLYWRRGGLHVTMINHIRNRVEAIIYRNEFRFRIRCMFRYICGMKSAPMCTPLNVLLEDISEDYKDDALWLIGMVIFDKLFVKRLGDMYH